MDAIRRHIENNNGLTFFGGKNGYDYICFDNHGKIMCSGGKLDDLIKTAEKHNWAVAVLVPVKFSNGNKE